MLPSCTTDRWMKNMHQRFSEATHEKSLELPSPDGKFLGVLQFFNGRQNRGLVEDT